MEAKELVRSSATNIPEIQATRKALVNQRILKKMKLVTIIGLTESCRKLFQ